MATDILLEDELARQRIANDTDRNIFVEASAGSGKTTGLTDRMLAMVCKGTDISEICAITFTKAAAREFYSRFRDKLSKTIKNTDDDTVRERCVTALRNIDLCFMGTIDSFCNTVMSEHPNEARIPASASVISDAQLAARCRKAYSNIITGKCGDSELNKKVALLNVYIPRDDLRCSFFNDLLSMLLPHRGAEIHFDPPPEDPDTAFVNEYDTLKRVCGSLIKNKQLINKNKPPQEAIASIEKRAHILSAPLSKNISDIVSLTGDIKKILLDDIPGDILAAAPDLFVKTEKKRCSYYEADGDAFRRLFGVFEEAQFSALMDFTVSAIDMITKELREKGELTFYDYLLYLRDLLREDASNGGKLTAYINRRYKYYLVDEFQDTDPLQAEIIFNLTAQQPNAEWYKCVPRKGSLFIVGDPKQSIYRFKGADVNSFRRIKDMFADDEVGEAVKLTRNFRSTPELCRWFNKKFSSMMPADTANNSAYSDIPVDPAAKDNAVTGAYLYEVGKETEISDIADAVIRLTEAKQISRRDKDGNVFTRDITFGDIMVIVSSKDNVGKYMHALAERGIPVMAEGRIIFSDCPLLKMLSLAVKSVAFPDDGAALYGVLTSPIFGITDKELIALRKDKFRLSLYSHDSEALSRNEAVKYAMDTLYELSTKVSALSASAAVDTVMTKLDLLRKFGGKDLEYYCYACELIRSAERTGAVTTFADAAELLESIVTSSISEERCIALQKGLNRVRLSNLHKVKGLQAPVVILASPDRRKRSPRSSSVHSEKGEDFYVFSAEGGKYISISTHKYDSIKDSEAESIEAEYKRLIYVAATRAENILIVTYKRLAKGGISEANYWYDLLDTETDADFKTFGKPVNALSPKKEVSSGELMDSAECADLSDGSVCGTTYSIERPSDIKGEKKAAKNSDEDIADDVSEDTDIPEESAAKTSLLPHIPANVLGTMAHRLMEIIVTSRGAAQRDASVTEIINDYWHEDGEVRKALVKLWNTMTSGGYEQENGTNADLLGELKDAECHCELPFCTYENGITVNGVMDLVYQKGGKWYIVDYKTNIDGNGLDEKYSTQLSAYRRALKELMGVEAESRIYHLPIHTV